MNPPWEPDFFPPEVWQLATNLGLLVAFVAFLSALGWVWKHGPELLIAHGFVWMTKLGMRWETRRNGESHSS